MESLLLLFLVLFTGTVVSGSHWRAKSSRHGNGHDNGWKNCPDIEGFFSYDTNSPCGPQHWHKKYPSCGGDEQSPINIQTDKVQREYDLGRVHYKPSGKAKGIFENNGHAPNFVVHEDDVSNILRLGGDNDNGYVFKELHFHIGARGSTYGSEHVVNKKGFKGEIHMVHVKIDDGNENGDAEEVLAVGVFFNVVQHCRSYADRLISKYITQIPKYLDKTDARVKPRKILPKDGKYYTYIGSKTTPVCTDDLLWIVFRTPTTVCKKNFKVLMDLETWEAGNPPLSKFGSNRPIQHYHVDVKANFDGRSKADNDQRWK